MRRTLISSAAGFIASAVRYRSNHARDDVRQRRCCCSGGTDEALTASRSNPAAPGRCQRRQNIGQ
eukprot:scaffold44782_cov20-Prasinocladus_malaysianus.AAC.1